MRYKVVKTLIKKELLDVIRDKKAVIMMLIVPLVVYPLIFFGTMAVMTAIQTGMEEHEYKVVIEPIEGPEYDAILSAIDEHNKPSKAGSSEKTDQLKSVRSDEEWDYDKAYAALQKEEIDAFVRIWSQDIDGRPVYQIVYVSSITNSSYAADILKSVLNKMNKDESERLIS